jgi:chromosomal replication initiation ATPase DnaA
LSPRARSIIREVAAEHGVTEQDITSSSTKRKAAHARHEVWRRLREVMVGNRPMSFTAIGRMFGRDHTTVMSGCDGRKRARPEYPRQEVIPKQGITCGADGLSHSNAKQSTIGLPS